MGGGDSDGRDVEGDCDSYRNLLLYLYCVSALLPQGVYNLVVLRVQCSHLTRMFVANRGQSLDAQAAKICLDNA